MGLAKVDAAAFQRVEELAGPVMARADGAERRAENAGSVSRVQRSGRLTAAHVTGNKHHSKPTVGEASRREPVVSLIHTAALSTKEQMCQEERDTAQEGDDHEQDEANASGPPVDLRGRIAT
eukprot:scaffold8214_cov121-Isochrysis_galbana.AAC.7